PENSCPIVKGAFSSVSGSFSSVGTNTGPSWYSCKSLPHIPAQETLTFTSLSFIGLSATSSTRMSFFPCHTAAFIFCILLEFFLSLQLKGEPLHTSLI